MMFEELLERVPPEGVFRTGQILAGERSPADVRRQLHRWCERGRIVQLRRGVYMVAEHGQHERTHPFVIANWLRSGSYVSLQSALAHYGMIPEYVPVVTSVTTGRPETLTNAIGRFQFRHVHRRLFHGFEPVRLSPGHDAFLATPEKALLDLLYLTPDSDDVNALAELRLQLPDRVEADVFWQRMDQATKRYAVAKLDRAVNRLRRILQ